LRFKSNYIYEVVKRKAIRIERLPAPIPEKQKEVKITSYMNNTRPFWNTRKETNFERKRICIICGQTAAFVAYFQIDKAQIIEKYCEQCLDKWVYLNIDESIPAIY
jgi:hypothetical protein